MISNERLSNLCRALAAAVRSGLPLSEAFEALAKSRTHGKLLSGAAELTAQGVFLHKALNAQKIFPPVFIALVRAGEEGGKTDEFLDLFAGSLDVSIEFRRRIKRALVYPGFVIILAAALLLAVSFKAVPMLLEPLLGAGFAVPDPALRLSRLAGSIREHLALALASLLVSGMALRSFIASGAGRRLLTLAGHWLPGFRFATEQARFYDIYMTMGLLFKAGVTLSAMLDILLQFSHDDPVTRRRLLRAAAMLSGGESFSGSLARLLPPEDGVALEIAEKAGRLEETVFRLGKNHYDRHLHRLKLLAAGFTLAATVTLAPLCFGLLVTLIRPALSVINEMNGLDGGAPSGLSAPVHAPPRDSGRTQGLSHGLETERTALFNRSQGGKVAEFMKEHAPAGRADPEPGTPAAAPKKLSPVPRIRKIRPSTIEPTPIRPADTGGPGNY